LRRRIGHCGGSARSAGGVHELAEELLDGGVGAVGGGDHGAVAEQGTAPADEGGELPDAAVGAVRMKSDCAIASPGTSMCVNPPAWHEARVSRAAPARG
jgi:hypothetical protein